jgi:hypothetical protein
VSELHKYYSHRLLGLLTLALGATIALDDVHTRLAKNHAAKWALDASNLLNHHLVLGALLLSGEMCIRKWLWRIEKPHLDFSGRWRGTTEYTEQWLDADGSIPDTAEHEIDIKQDCLGIAIEPTAAEAFTQWHSLICDLVPKGIAYTYEVTYNNKLGLPSKAQGYEVLIVVTSGKRRRPKLIAGDFHHLVSDDKPVFSGLAKFERISDQRARRREMPGARPRQNDQTHSRAN